MPNLNLAHRVEPTEEVGSTKIIVNGMVNDSVMVWREADSQLVISALISKVDRVRQHQLSKTIKKMPYLSEQQLSCLDTMTREMVQDLIGDIIDGLTKASHFKKQSELVKRLFKL